MNYIYSLVDETVRCAMNLRRHRCRKWQCPSCSVWRRIQACSSDLNDWEKLEVQRMTRINLSNEIYTDRSCRRSQRRIKMIIAMLIVIMLFAFGKGCGLHAFPGYFSYDYYVNDSDIRSVLRTTHKNVHDCDLDGRINCCDYTLQFKKEWDKVMPPDYCEIVRNYQKRAGAREPVMNHLFVRVKLTAGGKWLYIEPQAYYYRDNYRMEDYWGNRYSSRYNNHGETSYWLNTWRK